MTTQPTKASDKKYAITITMKQTTDGESDNNVLVEEFSKEATPHLVKTQVFTEELTQAIARATKRLTDMALEQQ